MSRGDASIYVDQGGVEHVAIVTVAHTDGTVDLAVLKTSLRNVSRSSLPGPGKFFDPNWVEEAPAQPTEDAPPANVGLSYVPQLSETQTHMDRWKECSMLQGSSSPAGLWPPRNLDPVVSCPVVGCEIAIAHDHGESSTPQQNIADAEHPVENPAHGAPVDMTPFTDPHPAVADGIVDVEDPEPQAG